MNHLEQIKQKLVIKPIVREREKVDVILKSEEKKKKETIQKKESLIEEGLTELGEQISKVENIEGILPYEIDIDNKDVEEEEKKEKIIRPTIIDMTDKGYDRNELLKKLAENKKSMITIKPTLIEKIKVIEKIPDLKEKAVKPKKVETKKLLIIEEDDEEENKEEEKENQIEEKKEVEEYIPIKMPKEKKRITQKVEKGVAVLGPEVVIEMGDTNLTERLPKRSPPINIKVGNYIMNNREIFVNFINSLFEPYKQELEENKENISCDTLDEAKKSGDFSLLTHQKIVRDYMNLYTPYRGLLLYHGLGSGKTCTSIAIAEGMKDTKNVIIMTPASLRANYIQQLKECGDLIYKKKQFWEWISVTEHPEMLKTLSAILNLPQEFIKKNGGAFFINVKKPSNYDELSDTNKQILEVQINEMINQKYRFINYNGLREKRLSEMTSNYSINIFDNSVVIIDEAHNFISRIVNKLKKEKPIKEDKKGEKEHLPLNLATKLYEMLLSARNARIVLLSGTPVINYPNEFGILFNILRGYIKTWKIPLTVNTNKKIDRQVLQEMLLGEKTLDYLDYSPSSKELTITRNPFGFKNKIKKESGYQGVSNTKKNDKGKTEFDTEFISDADFEKKIISALRRNDIDVIPDGINIKYLKALPDNFDEFIARYVDENERKLKNTDALKRRIVGLSSYFRSAQESLLPKYNKQLGVDYHIVRVPMSDFQFKIYEAARKDERELESKRPKRNMEDDYEDKTSTYRIFSRLACNFVIPDRPIPFKDKKNKDKDDLEKDVEENDIVNDLKQIVNALKQGKKLEGKQDVEDEREGEIEGDEILNSLGGTNYMERLQNKIKEMEAHSNEYFTTEELQKYSPKFLNILENIQDPEYQGLHLVYSQFRTAEGIGLFTSVLNKNGFTQFKIKKNSTGLWEINIPDVDNGKPTYALYTGTESVEEKEIIRKIYNGEWNDIPDSISNVLKQKYRNNNMGEVIKVFMITSSGSEGINLRNTRYVHLMDPYWHPVRSEQVIGRARRICSHKDLPIPLQTVEVFVYLMVFSEAQLKSDEAIELKRKDLSKAIPKVPFTSDQYLFEISEIKANLTNQLTEAIKESSFDCYIYSNGKCVNFGDPTINKFSYVPNYADQQNDTTVQANKQAIEWKGKPITINGKEYVYRRIDANKLNIYDKKSYELALKDSSIIPLQIGTLEKNERGENVFKALVTK
jgi:hypothetical protein